jgi:hypothetical protein
MRHLIIFSSILACLAGCNGNGNPIAAESDSASFGNLLFTLSVPNKTLPANDSLYAIVQVYNKATVQETFFVDATWFQWWLKTTSGTTIIYSYLGVTPIGLNLYINPNETEGISYYSIDYVLRDSSGARLKPGFYILQVEFLVGLPQTPPSQDPTLTLTTMLTLP